jgi:hypothetical protein
VTARDGQSRARWELQNEYHDTKDIPDAQKSAGAEENITYHDTDNKNDGSGALNGKGTYNKEFRISESPDISYHPVDLIGFPGSRAWGRIKTATV